MQRTRLGIRWTMGDVSDLGYEALRCSLIGAYRVFGRSAEYAVCVNTVPVRRVESRMGTLPQSIRWLDASAAVPPWLAAHLDPGLAEGVAWKLAPPRVFPDLYELALDNDCVLWEMPSALRAWIDDPHPAALVAEDVRACFGQLAPLCGETPRNLGIRGLPPHFDVERALREVLTEHPITLRSELDEQGLQLAALAELRAHTVSLDDVTICSPFRPHVRHLGRCGAHFCGLNARHLSFSVDGLPGERHVQMHFRRLLPEVRARTRAELP